MIIESYHAGVCFEPENKEDFMKKLSVIINPNNVKMYKEGCKRLSKDFDRSKLAKEMYTVIEAISM